MLCCGATSFQDFCAVYDERYAATYGMFRLDRIRDILAHLVKTGRAPPGFDPALLSWEPLDPPPHGQVETGAPALWRRSAQDERNGLCLRTLSSLSASVTPREPDSGRR